MLGRGQVTPENFPTRPLRGFFYSLVRRLVSAIKILCAWALGMAAFFALSMLVSLVAPREVSEVFALPLLGFITTWLAGYLLVMLLGSYRTSAVLWLCGIYFFVTVFAILMVTVEPHPHPVVLLIAIFTSIAGPWLGARFRSRRASSNFKSNGPPAAAVD
jgi:hypothetical protein